MLAVVGSSLIYAYIKAGMNSGGRLGFRDAAQEGRDVNVAHARRPDVCGAIWPTPTSIGSVLLPPPILFYFVRSLFFFFLSVSFSLLLPFFFRLVFVPACVKSRPTFAESDQALGPELGGKVTRKRNRKRNGA